MTEASLVLVIDDSEDDRVVYSRALRACRQAQYEVIECDDGDSGMRRIEEANPQCVLLDYSLPGRNGVEVLKRLRAKHPFLPVVMLTGQGNETVAVAAMQAGAQDYITKSAINADSLHHAISFAVAHCTMEKQLHEQRLSLEVFTRALAHDLREPVRTIKSFMAVLSEREPLSTDGKRYVGYVHDAADRMAALIDAVYYYTRLDSSAPQMQKEPCDVGAVLEETKLDLSELIREREAAITAGPLPSVIANRQQLRQVLQNLLANAIRHCDADPIIHVEAVDSKDAWTFRVTDNGDGVDDELREKVFEPFTRFAHRRVHGLGMGLAICSRIIEAHDGKIWCEEAPGGGSVFCFTLPKVPGVFAHVRSALPRNADAEPESQPLARVLVVDDNEAAIELARIVLTKSAKLRCVLVGASGGQEALNVLRDSAARDEAIDLILLDISMPRMDGFQFLEKVRADDTLRDLPVVMCTTSNYDKDIERAKALGANGYITKPPELNKLRPLLGAMPTLLLSEQADGRLLLRVA